ncbi:MAG: rRNA maturation RNase YbeY [bacterium]
MLNRINTVNMSDELSSLTVSTAEKILADNNILGSEVNIIVTDPGEMSGLNYQFRHKEGCTDVITFCMREGVNPQYSRNMLGDIYICPECFDDPSGSFLRRVIHGMLHLLGYDHNDSDREAFLRLENSYMNSIGGSKQ